MLASVRENQNGEKRKHLSLQQAINICLESGDSDLDSSIEELSTGEEY